MSYLRVKLDANDIYRLLQGKTIEVKGDWDHKFVDVQGVRIENKSYSENFPHNLPEYSKED
jgi:hypothetical protein